MYVVYYACTNTAQSKNKMHAMQCAYFFSVLTKRISTHKMKCLMNTSKYCFKNYIKLHELCRCLELSYL